MSPACPPSQGAQRRADGACDRTRTHRTASATRRGHDRTTPGSRARAAKYHANPANPRRSARPASECAGRNRLRSGPSPRTLGCASDGDGNRRRLRRGRLRPIHRTVRTRGGKLRLTCRTRSTQKGRALMTTLSGSLDPRQPNAAPAPLDGVDAKLERATQGIDASRRLGRILRLVGGAFLIASASTFLFHRWEQGSDSMRYAMLLLHTVFLTAAALFCGLGVRESRGARTFLAITLAIVPINAAVLGGLVYSQF